MSDPHLHLFDDASWNELLPLTYTRPVAELRLGIRTIREKWEDYLGQSTAYLTQDYLQAKYPANWGEVNLLINGALLPSPEIAREIQGVEPGTRLSANGKIVALFPPVGTNLETVTTVGVEKLDVRNLNSNYECVWVEQVSDIFSLNGAALNEDFDRITRGRTSAPLDASNRHFGNRLFIEEGAKVRGAILNSESGPIYLGKGSEVMEGSLIRGGLALCNNATLKLGAKIYGPTTVGPHSKVGGEVNNSVIQGYSNKGHDGFLGNSVIGEWCNLGADTNTSNLKNNYAKVKLWNYPKGGFKNTGLQFCGLIMGDHSKCGINTMFNTGTVIGVSANLFGSGFPRNFVPSYAWGGAAGFSVYRYEKAMEVAEVVMRRRNIDLDEIDRSILATVFERSESYRNF